MTKITWDNFFTILGNHQRVRILEYLKSGPKSVSQISDELNVQQSAVSHCLRKLRAFHFVDVRQVGKERIYSLNEETVIPLFDLASKHAKRYCVQKCEH